MEFPFFRAIKIPIGRIAILLILLTGTEPIQAESGDVRLQSLRNLNNYFPSTPPNTVEEWNARSQKLRQHILVALGLWPMPLRTPLNAVVYGKLDFSDYTVEKVYFESVPGFFVTGSLYRPKSETQCKRPAVLSPHGHWADGRFHDAGEETVKGQMTSGAELYQEGGRSPIQSRCVQLARMGCIVFIYDMIGYADSLQIPMEIAHGFSRQRPEMNCLENWGLFSPEAESHLQSVMELQTWNSIRALDFLCSLPDVDKNRIGVTGASGGGTQTFILCALDSRPAVAFPAVMVSTSMQGGCTCENACLLRIGAGNVDFAALFAPKPLGMTAANDWTREMPQKGFPELKKLYALLKAPDHVMLKALPQFGHNYNACSREAMYRWFDKYLQLSNASPIMERDYKRLSSSELTVWDATHPKPRGGPEFERSLLRYLTEDAAHQWRATLNSASAYRNFVAPALQSMIGRDWNNWGKAEFRETSRKSFPDCEQISGRIQNTVYREEVPVLLLKPVGRASRQTVIWLTENGKEGLLTNGNVLPAVRALLDGGCTVMGADVFLQGGSPVSVRLVHQPREAAAYTFGYNPTLLAQRVHDVLTLVGFAHGLDSKATVSLAGMDGSGLWTGLAGALIQDHVNAIAMNSAQFRFGDLTDFRDPRFLPGGAKYGDLPGLIRLCAPTPLFVKDETTRGQSLILQMYALEKARKCVKFCNANANNLEVSQWLLKQNGDGR